MNGIRTKKLSDKFLQKEIAKSKMVLRTMKARPHLLHTKAFTYRMKDKRTAPILHQMKRMKDLKEQ